MASDSHVFGWSLSAPMAVPWVTTFARLTLGGVLIAAGWLKIGAPALSVQAVKAYELLPDGVATAVGYGLPILEIVVGALLVLGLLTRPSAVVAGVLMLAFVIGIASAWARGLRIDCGCFGGDGTLAAGQDPAYPVELARDGGLMLCAAWIAWFKPGRFALDTLLGLDAGQDEDEENDL